MFATRCRPQGGVLEWRIARSRTHGSATLFIGTAVMTRTSSGLAPVSAPRSMRAFMAVFDPADDELPPHEAIVIHQRTMAGLAAARAQGRVGGRPSVMDPDKLAAARARLARRESATQIATALGVSRATLYRHTEVTTACGHSG